MVRNEERDKVKSLLTETLTLLCKNGLSYKAEFCIEALIGITLDRGDVFLINIKETINSSLRPSSEDDSVVTTHAVRPDGADWDSSSPHRTEGTPGNTRRRGWKSRTKPSSFANPPKLNDDGCLSSIHQNSMNDDGHIVQTRPSSGLKRRHKTSNDSPSRDSKYLHVHSSDTVPDDAHNIKVCENRTYRGKVHLDAPIVKSEPVDAVDLCADVSDNLNFSLGDNAALCQFPQSLDSVQYNSNAVTTTIAGNSTIFSSYTDQCALASATSMYVPYPSLDSVGEANDPTSGSALEPRNAYNVQNESFTDGLCGIPVGEGSTDFPDSYLRLLLLGCAGPLLSARSVKQYGPQALRKVASSQLCLMFRALQERGFGHVIEGMYPRRHFYFAKADPDTLQCRDDCTILDETRLASYRDKFCMRDSCFSKLSVTTLDEVYAVLQDACGEDYVSKVRAILSAPSAPCPQQQ